MLFRFAKDMLRTQVGTVRARMSSPVHKLIAPPLPLPWREGLTPRGLSRPLISSTYLVHLHTAVPCEVTRHFNLSTEDRHRRCPNHVSLVRFERQKNSHASPHSVEIIRRRREITEHPANDIIDLPGIGIWAESERITNQRIGGVAQKKRRDG